MTPTEASAFIRRDDGRFTGVRFIKLDGTPREMLCRFKRIVPTKGEARSTAERIIVYDQAAGDYRCIPAERITAVKCGGNWIEVRPAASMHCERK